MRWDDLRRSSNVEDYRGRVVLYRREGPPRHVLAQIGQFAQVEPLVVLAGSPEEPTAAPEEPTAAEVERAAVVLSQEAKATGDQGDWNPWNMLDDSEKEELRREARAVLKGARDGTAAMPEEGLEPPTRGF